MYCRGSDAGKIPTTASPSVAIRAAAQQLRTMGEIVEIGAAALSPRTSKLLKQVRAKSKSYLARTPIPPRTRTRTVRQVSPTQETAVAASFGAAMFIASTRREASLRRAGQMSVRPTPSYVQAGNIVEFVDMNDPEVAAVLNWDRPSDLDYSEDTAL